jgi:hypothetical protein
MFHFGVFEPHVFEHSKKANFENLDYHSKHKHKTHALARHKEYVFKGRKK